MKPCGDCGVQPGEPHEDGCDVARCMWTGAQRIQCVGGLTAACCKVLRDAARPDLADDLAHYLSLDDPDHDCGTDVWTGVWPGLAEAAEFGWYAYFGPEYGQTGWVRCPPDDPRGSPDLNRLATSAKWSREQGRWVLP